MNPSVSIGLSIGLDSVENINISNEEIDSIMSPRLSPQSTMRSFDAIVDKTAMPSLRLVKSVIQLFTEKPNHYNTSNDNVSVLENQSTKTVDLNRLPCLVSSSALPEWYGYYENVKDGYRLHYTHCQALWSIFQWHSETVNIWTEFIPLIVLYVSYLVCVRV